MKVALSIPDELFDSAETLGKRLGVSRSRLYATALADFVAKHQNRKVTERLNAVHAAEDSRLDGRLRRAQARSLPRDPFWLSKATRSTEAASGPSLRSC